MIDRLRPILARIANHSGSIMPETQLRDGLGIDSLAMIDLAVVLEDIFHVRVPDEAAERFRTVGDILVFLNQPGPH